MARNRNLHRLKNKPRASRRVQYPECPLCKKAIARGQEARAIIFTGKHVWATQVARSNNWDILSSR